MRRIVSTYLAFLINVLRDLLYLRYNVFYKRAVYIDELSTFTKLLLKSLLSINIIIITISIALK
jgi:hypothetical protein